MDRPVYSRFLWSDVKKEPRCIPALPLQLLSLHLPTFISVFPLCLRLPHAPAVSRTLSSCYLADGSCPPPPLAATLKPALPVWWGPLSKASASVLFDVAFTSIIRKVLFENDPERTRILAVNNVKGAGWKQLMLEELAPVVVQKLCFSLIMSTCSQSFWWKAPKLVLVFKGKTIGEVTDHEEASALLQSLLQEESRSIETCRTSGLHHSPARGGSSGPLSLSEKVYISRFFL